MSSLNLKNSSALSPGTAVVYMLTSDEGHKTPLIRVTVPYLMSRSVSFKSVRNSCSDSKSLVVSTPLRRIYSWRISSCKRIRKVSPIQYFTERKLTSLDSGSFSNTRYRVLRSRKASELVRAFCTRAKVRSRSCFAQGTTHEIRLEGTHVPSESLTA